MPWASLTRSVIVSFFSSGRSTAFESRLGTREVVAAELFELLFLSSSKPKEWFRDRGLSLELLDELELPDDADELDALALVDELLSGFDLDL